jgi:hypothetical protein
MKYFIFDTEQEVRIADSIICMAEGIGNDFDDVTKNYALPYNLGNGKWGYLYDETTSKYINRQIIEINETNN